MVAGSAAGPRTRAIARRAGRIRWVRKARVLRFYRSESTATLGARLRYLAWDPEVDNFTYDLANEAELAHFVADATGTTAGEVLGLIDEAHSDPVLTSVARGVRWRHLYSKGRLPLGRRLAWYAAARVLKPALVVEAGTRDGLGALTLLRALERNASAGNSGRLISFDVVPGSGWLVPESLSANWDLILAPAIDALDWAVAGQEVGMFIHDSEPTYECERLEFEAALRHAASTLAMFTNGQWSTALEDLCREQNARYLTFRERPANHFYPGSVVALGIAGGQPDGVETEAPQNAAMSSATAPHE